MSSHSLFNRPRLMHQMPVENQENLAPTCRINRCKKRSSTAVQNDSANTRKVSFPWLVIVEILLQPTRCPIPGITGVCPRRP